MLFSTDRRCKSWVFYAYSLRIYPMDLLSFDAEPLFFDTPPADEVVQLLQQAAENYGDEQAEADLQRAYHLAPNHLMVLVALFRYHVYQQRFLEALAISQQAREVIRQPLDLPHDWRTLSAAHLSGREKSRVMVRFYLLCLKGEAYLYARLGEQEQATVLLEKIIEIDTQDRLGAAALLTVVNDQKHTRRPS
jgi:tetratricopeptide (TPR) repeat protein